MTFQNIDFIGFLIACGLGLLVGLQRQWVEERIAGIRTFSFITVFGFLCGHFSQQLDFPLMVLGGLLCVAILLVLGNWIQTKKTDLDSGMTTEMTALIMYFVGVFVSSHSYAVGVVVTGVVVVLLSLKNKLHVWTSSISKTEFKSITSFVILAFVILPLLPNENYGPFDVFNPFKIWLMVVLIVGISLAAYIILRFMGNRAGVVLSGFLGGLISSTAVSVSYARKSKKDSSFAKVAPVMILISSAIVFIRVIIEILVVAPTSIFFTGPPLFIMFLFMILLSFIYLRKTNMTVQLEEEKKPPAELMTAIIFGFLYAVILFLVAVAKEYFGDQGLYVLAVLSGLTDMDAITLSTSHFMQEGRIIFSTGWKIILIAGMSNIVFKGAIVTILAAPSVKKKILICFLSSILLGTTLILFYQ